MWRGFAAGTLALIALYVVVQPGTASKSEQASNALQVGLRRWLSPQVAGIPDRSSKKPSGWSFSSAPSTGTAPGALFSTPGSISI